MAANKTVRWAAIVALVAGGGAFVGQAMTQDAKTPAAQPQPQPTTPAADNMSEWLKARGIQMSPEQIEAARKMVEDVRSGGQVDPEQVQKIVADISKQVQARAQSRIKDALGATDAEWEVLGPKVAKVQGLMLQGSNIGMGLARFGMGGLNLSGGTEQSETQKKLQALQEIMKNKDAAVDDVRAALKNYREAQAKTKADLDKARAEVKELLTVRQEAQLVKMGIIE